MFSMSVGQNQRASHPRQMDHPSINRTNKQISADLWGPTKYHGLEGERYMLVAVDNYSNLVYVKCIQYKHEAFEGFDCSSQQSTREATSISPQGWRISLQQI